MGRRYRVSLVYTVEVPEDERFRPTPEDLVFHGLAYRAHRGVLVPPGHRFDEIVASDVSLAIQPDSNVPRPPAEESPR